MAEKPKNRFITGYSGLRALAVIGVILYHLNPNVFVGGYLGVPIFFVLSGYLVTDHMLTSYNQVGYYDNKHFYLGRLKKIYPQLITVLWGSAAYILLFQQNLLSKLHQIVLTNLLNVYNWWQISNGQSYFERFASNESPFTHLWTMSIDGQFYLFWPLIIFLVVKGLPKIRARFWFFMGLSLLSAVEMALLYQPGVDTSRIYYGTDTRFFALGLGAALAVIWPEIRLKKQIALKDSRILDVIGGIAFVGMLVLAFNPIMNAQKAFVYRGGMFLFTFLTTVLVGIVVHPASHWNKWLTNPVFNWIGSRSYGIYLYQFPVMIFFEDKVKDIANHVLLYHVIEVFLILLLSELTYRFIEKPLGKVTWVKTKSAVKNFFTPRKTSFAAKLAVSFLVIVLILGTTAIGKAPSVKAQNPNATPLAKQIARNRRKQARDNAAIIAQAKHRKHVKLVPKPKLYRDALSRAKTHPINQQFENYGISQVELQIAQKIPVTAIGDSVMAGSSQDIKLLLPNALIDAAVSRQLINTFDLVQSYKNKGVLNTDVLIGLGTNGPFTMNDLNHMMKIIGSNRQVFWINTRVPTRAWQDQVNQLLTQAAKKYSNLNIIDWYHYSNAHSNWFYEDQTHPNPEGAKYYSAFIAKNLVEITLEKSKNR